MRSFAFHRSSESTGDGSNTLATLALEPGWISQEGHQFESLRRLARQPLAAASLVVIAFTLLCALVPSLIAPEDPLKSNVLERLQGPSAGHLLGTDELGRDVLSRIIHGARTSLTVGVLAVVIGTGLGVVVGLSSGYLGGIFDIATQRFVDGLLAFPGLILALALMSVYGAGIAQETVVIGILAAPSQARVVRSAVLSAKEEQYVEAARTLGAGDGRIMVRHILPNIFAPILILASVTLGFAILVEGSLSYLGLGTPPPTPSWGGMIAGGGGAYLEKAPTLSIFPGVALTLVVLACNLLGDSLRDVWDPRLRGR